MTTMKMVHLSNETMNAIRANAKNPFYQTGEQLKDGSWLLPMEEETLERLEDRILEGESISDCILRIINILGKPLQ